MASELAFQSTSIPGQTGSGANPPAFAKVGETSLSVFCQLLSEQSCPAGTHSGSFSHPLLKRGAEGGAKHVPHEWPLTCDPRSTAPVELPRDAQHRARHLDCAQEALVSCRFSKSCFRGAEVGVLKIIKVSSEKKKSGPHLLLKTKCQEKEKGRKAMW